MYIINGFFHWESGEQVAERERKVWGVKSGFLGIYMYKSLPFNLNK